MDKFEQLIRKLTGEINGQYPRPWMTDLTDPSSAEVFIVGYNPATPYLSNVVNYERFVDSLFNRNGEKCRKFYKEVTEQSPTRANIQMLTAKLEKVGVTSILETNVVCYGAENKKDLNLPKHYGGKVHGMKIFCKLVKTIHPKVIIIHGQGVCDEFSKLFNLNQRLLKPPDTKDKFVQIELDFGSQLFVIPSLALPGFRNWSKAPLKSFCNWADEYLEEVSRRVSIACAS